MPTTLILGGHGRVAQELTRILTSGKETNGPAHKVYSIIRDPGQKPDIVALGAEPIVLSLEEASVTELAGVIAAKGPDFVVWAASAAFSTPERTGPVDRDAAIKAMDALALAGRGDKRYLHISSMDVRDRVDRPVPDWYNTEDRLLSERLRSVIGPWLDAKLASDRSLKTENGRRGLAYTIIRPGGLASGPGAGYVGAGRLHLGGPPISRADVARALLAAMEEPRTAGLAFDVSAGRKPVRDAVAEVARERTDSFDGYY